MLLICDVIILTSFSSIRLHPNPLLLIGHFFAVALYAVYQIVTNHKIYQLHYAAYSAAITFFKACQIIFPLIISEFKNFAG